MSVDCSCVSSSSYYQLRIYSNFNYRGTALPLYVGMDLTTQYIISTKCLDIVTVPR